MIRKKKPYKRHNRRNFIQANHRIRFPEVRVLTDSGEMLGLMSTGEALEKARVAGKDLVLLTEKAKPPVCKIIELSKFKYQLKQKQSDQRKKAKAQELKEVRFSPFMGDNDLESRIRRVIEFLKKGNKVRMTLMFKGRQITKKEFGFELFDKVFEQTKEISDVELPPKMLGKKLIAQLTPSKKVKNEKS